MGKPSLLRVHEVDMITGTERVIKKYILIDRCGEGYIFIEPKDDEQFWGIPYGWHGDNSMPVIEVRIDGKVTKAINCADVSEIIF